MLNQQEKEESLSSLIVRTSVNTFHRAEIFCKKPERNAKLALKKHQLNQVKKSFGVDYMNLLEKDANPDELEQCMRDGHEKMGNLNKDIRMLRAEKTSLDDLLKQKLVPKPASHQQQTEVEPARYQYTPGMDSLEAKVDSSTAAGENVTSDEKTPQVEAFVDAQANPPTAEANESGEIIPPGQPSATGNDQEDEFVVLPPPREDSP